jgi:hypothetical protein
MKRSIYLISLLFLAASCQKFDPGDCFTNAGPVSAEEREVSPYQYLHLKNNVDVFISYAQEYSITVRAGKNVIQGIKTSISGKTLTITNENRCNWIRSYDKPLEVYLGLPRIDSILYESSGNLTSLNKFTGDSIRLEVLEGAGSINLWLNMQKSRFNIHYGTVDLKVRGYSHISYLYSGGYGPADLRDLNTVFHYMTNNSTNNCFVRASLELQVKIFNVGDVYYYGDPASVSLEGDGSGKLYKR